MGEQVKIVRLIIRNTKAIEELDVELALNGVTSIGGGCGEGKSTVLDAPSFVLGGEKYRPSDLQRHGADEYPYIAVFLNTGWKAERMGKNAALKFTGPDGAHGGQQLINAFLSTFALDDRKFRNASKKGKYEILLRTAGLGDELAELEKKEDGFFALRTDLGRDADRMEAYAKSLPWHDDAPDAEVSVADLVSEHQRIRSANAANDDARRSLAALAAEGKGKASKSATIAAQIVSLQAQQKEADADLTASRVAYDQTRKSVEALVDDDPAPVLGQIANAEGTNTKVRENAAQLAAHLAAQEKRSEYASAHSSLLSTREGLAKILDGAEMPLEGMSLDHGEVVYQGQKWDCMAESEHRIVSTAIVRTENPKCGFLFADGLECMDLPTFEAYDAYAKSVGLQILGTRVSQGAENSFILEGGKAKEQS